MRISPNSARRRFVPGTYTVVRPLVPLASPFAFETRRTKGRTSSIRIEPITRGRKKRLGPAAEFSFIRAPVRSGESSGFGRWRHASFALSALILRRTCVSTPVIYVCFFAAADLLLLRGIRSSRHTKQGRCIRVGSWWVRCLGVLFGAEFLPRKHVNFRQINALWLKFVRKFEQPSYGSNKTIVRSCLLLCTSMCYKKNLYWSKKRNISLGVVFHTCIIHRTRVSLSHQWLCS